MRSHGLKTLLEKGLDKIYVFVGHFRLNALTTVAQRATIKE
jgi:hypothetical protein